MDSSALDKALSILESDISRLEPYIDSLEKWLWISSVAVVVGVTAELYLIIRAYLEDRAAWIKGSIASPAKPRLWLLGIEVISVVLVVLGVAGELAVGVLSANANGRLRNKNDSRVQLIRQRAGDALSLATKTEQEAAIALNHKGSATVVNGRVGIVVDLLSMSLEQDVTTRDVLFDGGKA